MTDFTVKCLGDLLIWVETLDPTLPVSLEQEHTLVAILKEILGGSKNSRYTRYSQIYKRVNEIVNRNSPLIVFQKACIE